jgi:hypothetical protein
VDLQAYRTVTRELDAAHDQLAREHEHLTSEAAMPVLPDPSLAWEDLSAVDRRALTEMLVDKIIIERHPSKIGVDGSRHYLIRAIPYQDPEMEAVRLKAMHEASQDRPQGLSGDPARSHTQTRPATSERVCFRLDSMRGDEDHGMRNSGPGLALNLRTFARA